MKFRGTHLETNNTKTIEIRRITTKHLTQLMEKGVIHIPNCQRELDHDKVEDFIKVSNENMDHFKYHCPRIQFGLMYDKYYLIDGQHRCNTFKQIYENTGTIHTIDVVITKLNNPKEMENMYYNLNKENTTLAIPIEEMKQAEETRKYYNIIQYLKKTFDESCFSARKNANYKYTIEEFINKLKQIELYKIDGIDTPEKAINFISDKNREFFNSVKIYDYPEDAMDLLFYKKEIPNIENECPMMLKRNNFFDFLKNNEVVPVHKSRRKRKDISKALRMRVWYEKAKVNDYKCYVCKCDITKKDFHTAHIMPYCNGGENKFDNLEATCETCNLQMGDKHMDTYINQVFN
jgi:hypothetical protein